MTIQGYLQRQQRKEQLAADEEGNIASSSASRSSRVGRSPGGVYSDEQLELIRRTQRAFRAHIRQQAAEAQELHHATRSTSSIGDVEHSNLCAILRRCALSGDGANLSPGEREELTKLQLAFRENLERKRRAAGIISNAFHSWTHGGVQGS
uniref:Uncharacterized protein n=1 Tax=Haptolina ericina TaxID=156174 RepID=A0A7S3B7C5_9EUKA